MCILYQVSYRCNHIPPPRTPGSELIPCASNISPTACPEGIEIISLPALYRPGTRFKGKCRECRLRDGRRWRLGLPELVVGEGEGGEKTVKWGVGDGGVGDKGKGEDGEKRRGKNIWKGFAAGLRSDGFTGGSVKGSVKGRPRSNNVTSTSNSTSSSTSSFISSSDSDTSSIPGSKGSNYGTMAGLRKRSGRSRISANSGARRRPLFGFPPTDDTTNPTLSSLLQDGNEVVKDEEYGSDTGSESEKEDDDTTASESGNQSGSLKGKEKATSRRGLLGRVSGYLGFGVVGKDTKRDGARAPRASSSPVILGSGSAFSTTSNSAFTSTSNKTRSETEAGSESEDGTATETDEAKGEEESDEGESTETEETPPRLPSLSSWSESAPTRQRPHIRSINKASRRKATESDITSTPRPPSITSWSESPRPSFKNISRASHEEDADTWDTEFPSRLPSPFHRSTLRTGAGSRLSLHPIKHLLEDEQHRVANGDEISFPDCEEGDGNYQCETRDRDVAETETETEIDDGESEDDEQRREQEEKDAFEAGSDLGLGLGLGLGGPLSAASGGRLKARKRERERRVSLREPWMGMGYESSGVSAEEGGHEEGKGESGYGDVHGNGVRDEGIEGEGDYEDANGTGDIGVRVRTVEDEDELRNIEEQLSVCLPVTARVENYFGEGRERGKRDWGSGSWGGA